MNICYICEQEKLKGKRGCKKHLVEMVKKDRIWENAVRKKHLGIQKNVVFWNGLPDTITIN